MPESLTTAELAEFAREYCEFLDSIDPGPVEDERPHLTCEPGQLPTAVERQWSARCWSLVAELSGERADRTTPNGRRDVKIKVERVNAGVRVTVGGDGGKPVVATLTPQEIASLTALLHMATKATPGQFTFDYEAQG